MRTCSHKPSAHIGRLRFVFPINQARKDNPMNRISRRHAIKLLATSFLSFPTSAICKQITPPPSCMEREGYGTWITGGPQIEFAYMLDGIVRKVYMELRGPNPVVRVTWKKFVAKHSIPDIPPTQFGTATARRAVELAKREMPNKLISGYETPEKYYVMIHEDPNLTTLIRPLASALATAAAAYGKVGESVDPVRNVLSFVQSLPHECNDGVGPRWPTESLLDSAADCDDKTILACALLNETMRYYTTPVPSWVMLSYPEHLTIGLNARFCKAWDSGAKSFKVFGHQFIYVEMNGGPYWEVGRIPPELASQKATVWPHPELVKPKGDCRKKFNGRAYYHTWKCKT